MWEQQEGSLAGLHNSPLTITLLDFMFSINGLEIEAILREEVKRKQFFFLPLAALLHLGARLSSERSRAKHRYDLTLENEVLFGGNTLIFITRKTASQGTEDLKRADLARS